MNKMFINLTPVMQIVFFFFLLLFKELLLLERLRKKLAYVNVQIDPF